MSTTPTVKKISQVAMVVRDCAATARRYWTDLGVGPWRFYTFNPSNTPAMTLRGRPVAHSFRVALAEVGDVTLELIEPLEGDSLYAEHLASHGEGLHHIAVDVDDFEAARLLIGAKGYSEIQSGRPFDVGSYVYFDTDRRLACITELGSEIDNGKTFPEPQSTYP